MSISANLQLPYLAAGQAQKHVTVNEALLRLDALVQLSVVSATTNTQPASPADGDIYILPAGKTGAAWGGMATHALAYYRDGAWEEITPREGWLAFAKDQNHISVFSGADWLALGDIVSADGLTGDVVVEKLSGNASLTVRAEGGTQLVGERYSSNASPAVVNFRKARGTVAAPSKALSGDSLFQFTGQPYNGSSFANGVRLRGVLTQDADLGSGGKWEFATCDAGGAALTNRISIGLGVFMEGATGGDKGAGTINATAVYDDNVLLTCGPVELLREGRIDLAKWDALAPEGCRHEAMHGFAAMCAEGFDPRDADNYCSRLTTDGAPPGLYTEAEWSALAARGEKPDIGAALTRAFLALDNLAVAFDAALKRITALEARVQR